MQPTQAMYDAATKAALAVIEADIKQDVPSFFQSEIPQDKVSQVAADIGKACADATEAAREAAS